MTSTKIEIPEELKSYKGPFGLAAVMVTLTGIALNLPDDYITKLNERWMIITIPAVIFLIGAFGQAYLAEHKNRTKVEEGISAELKALSLSIRQLFANREDDKKHLDQHFGAVTAEHQVLSDNLRCVYRVLAKRGDDGGSVTHQDGDTEKFFAQH